MKSDRTLIYYIPKVLKNISNYYITYDAKSQLNQIIFAISHFIIDTSVKLLTTTGKSILNISTLVNALRTVASGVLLQNLLTEGDTHVKMNNSKEIRESLTFPPSFFRNMVAKRIPSHMKISFAYSVFLASAMEYICVEILELSTVQAMKKNHVRIIGRDMYLAIHYDEELSRMCRLVKINIIGSGIVPHNDELDEESKQLQSSFELLLPRISFQHLVRDICHSLSTEDVKIAKKTFTILQYYIEQYIINILQWTGKMCEKTGKNKIVEEDLEFIYNILR